MLEVKTIEDAYEILKEEGKNLHIKTKRLSVEDALGRVVASDVTAQEEVPHFPRSAVDGYAVDHRSVALASESAPVPLKCRGAVKMGKAAARGISSDTTVYVPTGGHIPKGASAMVMIEDTEEIGEEILIKRAASKWENIQKKGSDMRQGDLLLNKGEKITSRTVGALKAVGIGAIDVYEPLSAALISTGDEIVTDKPAIGEVRDINTFSLSASLKKRGVILTDRAVIKDDPLVFKETITNALMGNHLVFISGGSSVGEEDYTRRVLEDIGATVHLHGLALKPGKPTIIATKEKKLLIGLPGHPMSAYVVLHLLFPAIMEAFTGLKERSAPPHEGVLETNVQGAPGRTTCQVVELVDDDPLRVRPLFAKSGAINALNRADGYIVIPAATEGFAKGRRVKVYGLED